ncbi:hypothetical protein LINPERHAP2_LOCUS45376 [Linum perenne]
MLCSTTILLFLSYSLNPCRSDQLCGDDKPEPGTGYKFRCNNNDGSKSSTAITAIDQVLDGLLTTKFFDEDNTYCDKSNTEHTIYGYIYCPSDNKTACQEDLSYGYEHGVQAECGRYRLGAMVVSSDGSCLRYEKYMFC